VASTLAAPHDYRETIKKSVFLAHAGPVTDAQAALAFIAAHGDPGATHNCWAYRIGAAYRFSDDGEPGGTAGRPMLQAIDSQDCDRVVVVVTRWYGGINLGTGGLARAYGGTAANCLRLATRVEIVEVVSATCACSYTDLQHLKARLAQAGATITHEDFDAGGVSLALSVPRHTLDALNEWFVNFSRGQSSLMIGDEGSAAAAGR
jgi:uncharacterized YigZ family protein